MRIVIDTNVLISGVFFGGFPRKILTSVVGQKITACATTEIINEYEELSQFPMLKYAVTLKMINFWDVQKILVPSI